MEITSACQDGLTDQEFLDLPRNLEVETRHAFIDHNGDETTITKDAVLFTEYSCGNKKICFTLADSEEGYHISEWTYVDDTLIDKNEFKVFPFGKEKEALSIIDEGTARLIFAGIGNE